MVLGYGEGLIEIPTRQFGNPSKSDPKLVEIFEDTRVILKVRV
jgi:hypothetical protein